MTSDLTRTFSALDINLTPPNGVEVVSTFDPTLVTSLDVVFSLVDGMNYTASEIKQTVLDLGVTEFNEPLVRGFIEHASVEGLRGFLASRQDLVFDFSLEDLSRELICNDAFADSTVSDQFWIKRAYLYCWIPCRDALYAHLETSRIIPSPENKDTVSITRDAYERFFLKIFETKSFSFSSHCRHFDIDDVAFCQFTHIVPFVKKEKVPFFENDNGIVFLTFIN